MGQTHMGPVEISPGSWRTLETFTGKVSSTIAIFRRPAGVELKVRYGVGWAGFDRQRQTTDGETEKRLSVSGWVVRARMQARVTRLTTLEWTRFMEGP
jgi:hypothetical protein